MTMYVKKQQKPKKKKLPPPNNVMWKSNLSEKSE